MNQVSKDGETYNCPLNANIFVTIFFVLNKLNRIFFKMLE